jgi:uncharacterized membrane protein YbhN (UPF0104 family)
VRDKGTSTASSTSLKARSPWRRRAPFGLRLATALALVVLVVSERNLLGESFRALGHLKWTWLVLAVDLEVLSMASFARMQCRLLNAGTATVRLLPVMATTFAGNAVSATVPVAGTQMSLLFVFRRFKKMGVDATVAGWTLVVAGIVSSLASALLFVLGAILTGNVVLAVTGAAGGVVGVALFALATMALRRPAMRAASSAGPRVGWWAAPGVCSAGPSPTRRQRWPALPPASAHCASHFRDGPWCSWWPY